MCKRLYPDQFLLHSEALRPIRQFNLTLNVNGGHAQLPEDVVLPAGNPPLTQPSITGFSGLYDR